MTEKPAMDERVQAAHLAARPLRQRASGCLFGPSTRLLSRPPRLELETLEAVIHDRPLLAD
jgi:hypothetical protein